MEINAYLSRNSFSESIFKKLETLTFSELYDIISLGLNIDFIYKIGKMRGICKEKIDSLNYRREKLTLPFFYGTCKREYHSKDIEPVCNGILHIDYDFKSDISDIGIELLKEKLKNCKYIYLMFTSPSGKGLKIFVKSYLENEELYKNYCYDFVKYLEKNYGISSKYFDSSITMRHVSFLSYDPEAYFDETSLFYNLESQSQVIVIKDKNPFICSDRIYL